MNKKTIKAISVIVLITLFVFGFIYFNNDHKECENVIEHSVGENGEKISTEKHICKERFSI